MDASSSKRPIVILVLEDKKDTKRRRSESNEASIDPLDTTRNPCNDSQFYEDLICYSPEPEFNQDSDSVIDVTVKDEPKQPVKVFLQGDSCFKTSPEIPQCHECEVDPMVYMYSCRFLEFRKIENVNGACRVAGFLDPHIDPNQKDITLWTRADDQLKVDQETCDYILSYIASNFCDLCESELKVSQQYQRLVWKRSVIQVREMCDVCETSIFNVHYSCKSCGTSICLDCKLEREQRVNRWKPKNKAEKDSRDSYFWLKCHGSVKHDLILTQMITGDSLTLLNGNLHELCEERNITQVCGCSLRNKNCIKALAKSIFIEQPQKKVELREIEKRQRHKTKKSRARRLSVMESNQIYQSVKLTYIAQGRILKLYEPLESNDTYKIFQHHWEQGHPVIVSNVTKNMNKSIWSPEYFSNRFGHEKHVMIDCKSSVAVNRVAMKYFWNGFASVQERLPFDSAEKLVLKLKDWPTSDDFADVMKEHYNDFMKAAPLSAYTTRQGKYNLTRYLPSHFCRPDLGPKMYSAYSQMHPAETGSTNLHLDVSDAINVLVHVSKPIDAHLAPSQYDTSSILLALQQAGADEFDKNQVIAGRKLPGAIWLIYPAYQADDIRKILHDVASEKRISLGVNDDPIHDQNFYIDHAIRERLKENGIEGFTIVQYEGDAVFIPAGAPHQVLNVLDCIKVALDFVAPENLSECMNLTEEFRVLSTRHENREDKLQIKNILYHTIKNLVPTEKRDLPTHSLVQSML